MLNQGKEVTVTFADFINGKHTGNIHASLYTAGKAGDGICGSQSNGGCHTGV